MNRAGPAGHDKAAILGLAQSPGAGRGCAVLRVGPAPLLLARGAGFDHPETAAAAERFGPAGQRETAVARLRQRVGGVTGDTAKGVLPLPGAVGAGLEQPEIRKPGAVRPSVAAQGIAAVAG